MADNYQSLAGQQGREFERQCRQVLDMQGWSLKPDHPRYRHQGVEIDIVAVNANGAEVWFECKGSMRGPRPGLLRTDTVKKAIANAFLLGPDHPPYVVLTSHLPDTKSVGFGFLQYAKYSGLLIPLCLYDSKHMEWLASWSKTVMPTAFTK